MKNAVIAVGSHYAGKSKTINKHLKPKLGIGEREHRFSRNDKKGFILSQSIEEAGNDVDDVVKMYSHYDLLILSSRPVEETPSCLLELRTALEAAAYRVDAVQVIKNSDEGYYDGKAYEIIRHLDE